MALKQVAGLTQQVVDNPEEADLIVVDSASNALKMLKEYDEAIIAVALIREARYEEPGARSLKEAYPKQVIIAQMYKTEDGTDDVLLVPYVMTFTNERKEKK
ncbi:MAG: hypothetical protein WCX17_02200 [Parcubacteria group bacterium]